MTALIWIYASKSYSPAHSECLKEWKLQANMTSAENKEYSGAWGWKGVVNVVHVRVYMPAKMCVGVPVRMFACDWVL